MFQYEFMRRAFVVGVLVSFIIPCIGAVMVNKKNSMVGDALSHTSLAGVCLGLILGMNPIVGAIIVCTVAAFSIEFFRKKFPKGSDLSTAIVMSTGIGLASILSDFVPGSKNLESFLFGSLVAIKDFEMYLVLVLSLIILLIFIKMYNGLVYIVFDPDQAKLSGVPVKGINRVFTLITALSISVASRSVGVLVISSLMILPVSAAIKLSNSFTRTVILSSSLGVLYTVLGIVISYYLGLKPGGTIVLIGVFALLLIMAIQGNKD
ncbi:MAG: metal ABC transporter permease [Tissierellia bacterium]|nr:metal ABC transporter permease [Tissierellia bacterium]